VTGRADVVTVALLASADPSPPHRTGPNRAPDDLERRRDRTVEGVDGDVGVVHLRTVGAERAGVQQVAGLGPGDLALVDVRDHDRAAVVSLAIRSASKPSSDEPNPSYSRVSA
jgi:hypothetical protein